MTTPDTDTLAGLHDTLGSVTVPDIMHGDNLAIALCTAYDNPDQDADEETGWTPDAIAGQEAVLAAIRDHYDPAIRCAIALRAQSAKDKARIERLQAALREAEETMKLVERPALPDPAYHQGVKSIGQRIGFGALMSTASAAWRETLEETGYPTGGEFVAGPCLDTVVSCLAKVRAALEDGE